MVHRSTASAGAAQEEHRTARPEVAGESPAPRSILDLPPPAVDFRTTGMADLLMVVAVVAALSGGSVLAGAAIAIVWGGL